MSRETGKVLGQGYCIVKRRIGLKNITMFLLFFDVAAQIFVVKTTVVFGSVGMICQQVMQQRGRDCRKANYKQQE